ncbi:MAG: ABC transporter substrate-binding protein [Acidimicrobiales bacterium]
MRHRPMALALALVAALLLAACGDDTDSDAVPQSGDRPEDTAGDTSPDGSDDPDDTTTDDAFPVTVEADNGSVTIEATPERIISLSATHTEMLFAMGADDQVAAVDLQSDYPPEAPDGELDAFQPNVEAIADLDPDLVVLSYDPGDVIESLELLDVPAILLDAPPDVDGIYRQIEVLGAATGNVGGAAEVVGQMETDIDQIVADLPEHAEGLTYFHELDDNYYSVTSETFIGQVYDLLGLENIADEAEGARSSGGYPQLSAEFIIESDPDLIFLADATCCDQSPETVASRPGWEGLSAVANDAVFVIDDDVASRWSPRIVDLLRNVAEAVSTLEPVG